MPYNASTVNQVKTAFPSVTVDRITEKFTSDMVYTVFEPTDILIIRGVWGKTEKLLDDMRIPYKMNTTTNVSSNPHILFDYDLIIDDCAGWSGSIPQNVSDVMKKLCYDGGELIFTDIALADMYHMFPNVIPVTGSFDGTFLCRIRKIPEFPAQYFGPSKVDIYTPPAGRIMMSTGNSSVRKLVDCSNYHGEYRILAAYFPYGKGIVEGFAYHPQEQKGEAYILASIFYGNKLIHTPPPDLTVKISNSVEPSTIWIEGCGREPQTANVTLTVTTIGADITSKNNLTVEERLYNYIIPTGYFSIPPTHLNTNPDGSTTIRWSVDSISQGKPWTVIYKIKSKRAGIVNINDVTYSIVSYTNNTGGAHSLQFNQLTIEVKKPGVNVPPGAPPPAPPPPLPPAPPPTLPPSPPALGPPGMPLVNPIVQPLMNPVLEGLVQPQLTIQQIPQVVTHPAMMPNFIPLVTALGVVEKVRIKHRIRAQRVVSGRVKEEKPHYIGD
jgi:hypothetical protein